MEALKSLFEGNEPLLYGVFGLIIIIFLVVDLGYLNKEPGKVSQKSALNQTIFWVVLSLLFTFVIYSFYGGDDPTEKSVSYVMAYLTEKALSLDNIFVILFILRYFQVEEKYYHQILVWGILGALVFRAIFIFSGALLISQFSWILYIFGIFLIYSGYTIFVTEEDDDAIDPESNVLLKLVRKYFRVSDADHGGDFFTRIEGKLYVTTLFLVVVLIESTDIIFAVDSIPAAFGITQDSTVIYTSNIFAVLGLRAMFFLLANIMDEFHLLQKGLSLVLIFIGVKLLLHLFEIEVPIFLSLAFIILTITLSIVLSKFFPKKSTGDKDDVLETESAAKPLAKKD